jgi:hypothetical protein
MQFEQSLMEHANAYQNNTDNGQGPDPEEKILGLHI